MIYRHILAATAAFLLVVQPAAAAEDDKKQVDTYQLLNLFGEVFERVRTAMGLSAEEWSIEKGPLFVGEALRPTRSPLDSSAFFMRFDVEQRTVKDSVREFVEQCREHFGVQVRDGSVA